MSEPPLAIDSGRRALRRLVSSTAQNELFSLIETIASNMKSADIVEFLRGSNVQAFIEVMNKVRMASSDSEVLA